MAMSSPQNAINVVEDDEVGSLPDSQRARALSVVSSASYHTLRAESQDPGEIPSIELLSVQPSLRPRLSGALSSEDAINGKRRRSTEFDVEDEYRQTRRLSLNEGPRRQIVDLEEDGIQIHSESKDEDKIIDIDKLEPKLEEEIFQERPPPRGRKAAQRAAALRTRNAPVVPPYVEIDVYKWKAGWNAKNQTWGEVSLKAGKTVEVNDGSFLKIWAVLQNLQTDEVTLRGWKLKRARELEGVLNKKVNEVTFIFEVDLDDPRHYLEQSIEEVWLKDLRQIRKMVCTNRPFPECRFDLNYVPGSTAKERMEYVEEMEVLVARWKFTTKFHSARDRLDNTIKPNNYQSCQLESLKDFECSHGGQYKMSADLRRYIWRGDTIFGGSGTQKFKEERKPPVRNGRINRSSRNNASVINLADDEDENDSEKANIANFPQRFSSAPKKKQVYTYGDTFSGGGGSMRGALMAGLMLMYGLDFCPHGCSTLEYNFPRAKVFEKAAYQFVALPDHLKELFVDILHLSPPCQVFSPVHTVPGRNDAMNFCSLFAVEELIKKAKPRMVTLEQTFGLLHDRFRDAFNSLIKMFTDLGFSVNWQIVDFHRLGLAQRRKRLIIVAAGPGEILPEFPQYTHSEHGGNGLKPYTSVRSVLNGIPSNAPNHNIAATYSRADRSPWDDSSITNCITTNGGEGCSHPSGQRGLTHRELAALQGFPHNHVFCGQEIRKQIGNAVPPIIARIIFESVRNHLEKVDVVQKQRSFNR